MMYREPSDSPWGLVVRCDTLCPGVYSVSTAGHGGIMAQIDAARQLLSPEAQAVGFQAGGYLNFEEDCDAPVVLRELMDSGIIAPRTDNYFRPGEYEACMLLNVTPLLQRPLRRSTALRSWSARRKAQSPSWASNSGSGAVVTFLMHGEIRTRQERKCKNAGTY